MKMIVKTVMATLMVAALLASAGCIGGIRNQVDGIISTPTPTATATPVPTVAPTATPTPTTGPTYYMPDDVDVIFIQPIYSGIMPSYITHVVNGSISFNNEPAVGWGILVETSAGNTFGNVTDATGHYTVKFAGNMDETYIIKLTDPLNNLIYQDKYPRKMSHVGPISIRMNVPSTNVYTMYIYPEPEVPVSGSSGTGY